MEYLFDDHRLKTHEYQRGSPLNIEVLRKRRGWSRKQVAYAVGCSVSLITKLEGGLLQPTGNMVASLATLFGVDQSWLFEKHKPEIGHPSTLENPINSPAALRANINATEGKRRELLESLVVGY